MSVHPGGWGSVCPPRCVPPHPLACPSVWVSGYASGCPSGGGVCLSSWVALYQGVHLSRVLSPCPSGWLLGRVCPPLWVLISPLGCPSVPLGVPLSFWGVCPYFWASVCPWRCLPECTLILLGLHLPPSWWPSVPRSLCPHVPPPPPDTTYMPLPTMYQPCAHLPSSPRPASSHPASPLCPVPRSGCPFSPTVTCPGLHVWRVEKLGLVEVPEATRSVFLGDGYLVLRSRTRQPPTLHLWLGEPQRARGTGGTGGLSSGGH